MKSSRFYYTLLILLTLVAVACEKNEQDPSFKTQARLLLSGLEAEGARTDTIGFTFAIWPTSLADTQVTVVAQTMGNLSGQDRSFSIAVDTGTTALPEEYSLPASFVIPADSFRARFPVTIKRSSRLTAQAVKLALVVKENEHFLPGPRFTGSVVYSGPRFSIVWTEVLTQPAIWNSSMLYAVGRWSRVKHQAIIDVTGIRNYEGLGYSQTYAIAATMLDWLNDYNASHPNDPLRDENGLEVKICSQCN
ncbi:MAG: DUF4843 domain-containing protein [Candidatus Pseudobacter hemicellulosilyticus]|uniref:DUF4843 domain-containing protein n=1 Tax=Candidatus Pseudobacter hemicellulosilyticus TaxID=3121375 RepID=A0AAJ6BIM3_9BACT|nr:MAG: DUF4843 domain-containing protein [Pseudobacter sp.]